MMGDALRMVSSFQSASFSLFVRGGGAGNESAAWGLFE